MRTVAVIGKNYGDEGKGLVTASLSSLCEHPLIVKHNGGAQAGHTVENEEKGTRFIHHQIGSGAEYGAHTLFAETYHPDLFQIEKEIQEFESVYGFIPEIFGEADTKITTIDDVLINMALETMRGDSRHGSCGMGINECVLRIEAGYAISLKDIAGYSEAELIYRLKNIRAEYTVSRMKELGIDETNPYHSLLTDENVLMNFAYSLKKNISLVRITDADCSWLANYDMLIFETGQGLLLDMDFTQNAPHLTSSKTGITESVGFLSKRNMILQEAIYVTRSYVTRHGAGPLPNEFERTIYPGIGVDITNEPNEWQGSIRYGKHTGMEDFLKPIIEDLGDTGIPISLVVTHLNETNGQMLFANGDIFFEHFASCVESEFKHIYASDNHTEINLREGHSQSENKE